MASRSKSEIPVEISRGSVVTSEYRHLRGTEDTATATAMARALHSEPRIKNTDEIMVRETDGNTRTDFISRLMNFHDKLQAFLDLSSSNVGVPGPDTRKGV